MPKTVLLFVLALTVLVGAVVLAPAREARAHAVGMSRAAYAAHGVVVTAELTFARAEIAGVVSSLDPDGAGAITPTTIEASTPALEHEIVRALAVSADGAPCEGAFDAAALTEQDGLVVRARYTCDAPAREVTVGAAGLFEALPHGHRQLAHAEGEEETLLYRGHDTLRFTGHPADDAGASPVPGAARSVGFFAMLEMGVLHILEGYDHLAFVFGLVLVGGRFRSLALVITAFTVAHSITLGLAALDVVRPSPRLVEPLVALSIAYVGVENFFVKTADRRWRITFPFGLVHGFAFASALREIDLSPGQVPGALLSFNLGVEIGQLLVMAPIVPAIYVLQRYPWFRKYAVKVASAGIVVMALVLFVDRLFG
jgi:hypothetical protein